MDTWEIYPPKGKEVKDTTNRTSGGNPEELRVETVSVKRNQIVHTLKAPKTQLTASKDKRLVVTRVYLMWEHAPTHTYLTHVPVFTARVHFQYARCTVRE